MNKHTKMALFVAPLLIVGGYIASDYYMEYKAQDARIFQLVPDGHCDVVSQKCLLKSGEFKINVSDKNGITEVNSTFPIDSATLFLVTDKNNAVAYPLAMTDSPYYWQSKTPLKEVAGKKGEKQKLRVIVSIKGGKYISEFYTQTTK